MKNWLRTISFTLAACLTLQLVAIRPTSKLLADTNPAPEEHHIIQVSQPANGGELEFKKTTAVEGEVFTFRDAPAAGYHLESLTTEPELTIDEDNDGLFSFVMPNQDVTITAAFSDVYHTGGLIITSSEEIRPGVDYTWDDSAHALTILTGKPLTFANVDPSEKVDARIIVAKDVPAHITLAGVNISTSKSSYFDNNCISIGETKADVRITLQDGTDNYIGAADGISIYKAKGVDSGTLILDGNGYLTSYPSVVTLPIIGAAGDGTFLGEVANITIRGGHYRFAGGMSASAIGGGFNTAASNIRIEGGTFTITGFFSAIGGGRTPYSKSAGSEVYVSEKASISVDNLKDAFLSDRTSEPTYCLVLDNPEGESIYIDGRKMPLTAHRATVNETLAKVYVYLDAASSTAPHEVRIGEEVRYVHYDTQNDQWVDDLGSSQKKISFEEASPVLLYEEGMTYENPLTNPNEDSTVVYSVEPEDVATIDDKGVLKILKTGEATVCAVSHKDGYLDTSAYYTLSVQKGYEVSCQASGGTVTADPEVALPGETIVLTLEPLPDNQLERLKILTKDNKNVAFDSQTNSFVMPASDVTVYADFKYDLHAVSIEQDLHGFVRATSQASSNEPVMLTVTPDTGYELKSVKVVKTSDSKEVPFDMDELYFTMPDSDVKVIPVFQKVNYGITLKPSVSGALSCENKTAAMGDRVYANIMMPKDSELLSIKVVTGKGKQVDTTKENDVSYSFVMPADEVDVIATFARLNHQVIIENGDHGTVTPSAEKARPGTVVKLEVTPESGYVLSNIQTVPGFEITRIDVNAYQFTMPDTGEDVKIVTAFAKGSAGTISSPWLIGTTGHEKDVIAYLTDGNVLHIEGNGAVKDFQNYETPWYQMFNSLSGLVVHEGVTEIGNYTLYHFFRLHNLSSVQLPESLTRIGDFGLAKMHYTSEVTIPENVKSIGSHAFDVSESLHKITFEGKPEFIAEDAFATVTADVYVPASWISDGSFDPSQHQYGGNLTYHISGADNQYLVQVATMTHGNLVADKTVAKEGEKVTLTVQEEVGWYILSCHTDPNLTLTDNKNGTYSFIMPDCNVSVEATFGQPGEKTRPWCIGSENPEDVKAWFDEASGTLYINTDKKDVRMKDFTSGQREWEEISTQVNTVVIQSSEIKNIGAEAFAGFTNLQIADLAMVTEVGDKAFYGCTSLEEISEPSRSSIQILGRSAFEKCTSLENGSMTNLVSMGDRCFAGCTAMQNAEMKGTLTVIPDSAWEGCAKLSDVSLPNTITQIGAKAFSGCKAVEEITIPADIAKIGSASFENCSSLSKITYLGKRPELASDAFRNDAAYVYVNYNFFDSKAKEVVQINDPNGTYYYGAKKLSYIVSPGAGASPKTHMVHINQTTGGKVYLSYVPSESGTRCEVLLESWGTIERGQATVASPSGLQLKRQDWIEEVYTYKNKNYYTFIMPDSDVTLNVEFNEEEPLIMDPPTIPSGTIVSEWEVGKNVASDVRAYIDGNTLYFEGKGEIRDYEINETPWANRKEIQKVVYGEGITSTGESSLFPLYNVSEIELPSTMKNLSQEAFFSTNVKNLIIPASVTTIGFNLFYRDDIQSVYFEGKPSSIQEEAFKYCTCDFYVDSSWLQGGVTLDMLNDPNGPYQYGGTITYHLVGSTEYAITANASEGGTIVPSAFTAYENEMITVKAIPDYGYQLKEVQISHADFKEQNKLFLMPNQDVTLYGVFTPIQYEIRISQDSGVVVSANKTQGYKETASLTVDVKDGYTLKNITVTDSEGNEVPLDESTMSFTMPASSVTVTATTVMNIYKVQTVANPNGDIVVSSDKSVRDKTITLKAYANPHYQFIKWQLKDSEGKTVSVSNDSFIMPASDVTVEAVFEPFYQITVTSTKGGVVKGNPETALSGTKVTLKPEAKLGYKFVRWESEDVTITEHSFTVPSKNVTIHAVFEEASYQIRTDATNHGTVVVQNTASAGQSISFTITPDEFYYTKEIQVVTKSGDSVLFQNDKFQMPYEDVVVKVVFAPIEATKEHPWEIGPKDNADDLVAYVEDGKLIIEGNGPMADFGAGSAPWKNLASEIVEIQLPEGLTTIGAGAFTRLNQVKEITIPKSVTTIGADALKDMDGITKITIPNTVTNISARALASCDNLKEIYVEGQPTIASDAMSDVEATMNVPHIWLNNDVHELDLNRWDGNYQYGGALKYFVREGTYSINIASTMHGEVRTYYRRVDQGEAITILITEDKNYIVDQVTVVDSQGKQVPCDGIHFTMPASSVTITVTFTFGIKPPEDIPLPPFPPIRPIHSAGTGGRNGAEKPGSDGYKIIEGAEQVVYINAKTAKFRSDAEFSKFVRVELDGNILDAQYYDAMSGSTIVILKEAYIKTLALGRHKLTIVSTDGSASTFFTVRDMKPKTGETGSSLAQMGIFLLAEGAALMIVTARKKKYEQF